MPCFLEKETNHRNQKRKFGVAKGMRWTQLVRNSSGDVYRGPSYMPCPDSPHVEYRRQGASPFYLWTTLNLPRPIHKSAFQTRSCYNQRSRLIPGEDPQLCFTWYHGAHTPDIMEPTPLILRGLQQWNNLSIIGIGEQQLFASKMHLTFTFQGLPVGTRVLFHTSSHLFPAGSRESYSFAPIALTFRRITLS